jgi:hypothetical protein
MRVLFFISRKCLTNLLEAQFFGGLRRGKPRLYTKWGVTTIYNRKIRLRVLIRL